MLISKICLTGGPCGGKTSSIKVIESSLKKMGYEVIIIDEAATELKKKGAIANVKSEEDFASLIVSYQIKRELMAEHIANVDNKQYVIISDRSSIEPAAYVGVNTVKKILKMYTYKSFESIQKSYDLVLHITTAAKGAEDFYTLNNNSARNENILSAIKIDDAILNIWNNHVNRVIIGNEYKGFDEKINSIKKEIESHINDKVKKRNCNKSELER